MNELERRINLRLLHFMLDYEDAEQSDEPFTREARESLRLRFIQDTIRTVKTYQEVS